MRAPISVIIPTLNAEEGLRLCLTSLDEGIEAGLISEIIVCDAGSADETETIAQAAGALIVTSEKGRGIQLRTGAHTASCEWLLFLHADSCLETDWSKTLIEYVQGPGMAFVFRLRFRSSGFAPRFVERWANWRTKLFALPYGDQGLLIQTKFYEELGGFKDMPLMEDVEFAQKLAGRFSVLPITLSTSARKYEQQGYFRRGAKNLSILLRYLCGADPEKLSKEYENRR